ncbi:MAG: phosphodiester glycosidase family protein [Erysipelotrichaceae bacterium]|nr:phosphodiester glycosidase family protein [Erysipelotrichaceae bacterium]
MIESEIRKITYRNNEIQLVQIVKADSFDQLEFFAPVNTPLAFKRLTDLYRDFIVARFPWFYARMVFFCIPDDIDDPFETDDPEYGMIYDKLARTKLAFRRHVKINRNQQPEIDDPITEEFFNLLKEKGCLQIICGNLTQTGIYSVANTFGMMSQSQTDARVKVNSSFFIMDRFDCGSLFDSIGMPIGLRVKGGKILAPALYDREALLVDKEGKVSVRNVSIDEISVIIDGTKYRNGVNCRYYTRPELKVTPQNDGTDIVIVADRIVSLNHHGNTEIPSSGFVISIDDDISVKDRTVSFAGMEEYSFAIQVGNSAVIDGKPTEEFKSKFYDFKTFNSISYPPAMYPLRYDSDRAPRIVLGADENGRPMILWFEGMGKFGYYPGKESRGVSLGEVARICLLAGVKNGVNLDGGGSAQILLDNQRTLRVSDRDPDDFSEKERAVPCGLLIRK